MSVHLPKQWLDKALEDLTVARLVLREGYTAHACFLAQQSMEKSLKACLLARSNAYPRTHKLVDLLGECQLLDPAFAQFRDDCLIVDQYYIPTRYPNGVPGGLPGGAPGQSEAEEAVSAAEKIWGLASSQLS